MTILLAILAAAQPAPELVERADQASQAYIDCLFATSREAHGKRLPLSDFKRRLAKACLAEERAGERLISQVLTQRGERNPVAAARQLSSEARRGVTDTYESLPRIESQLEDLADTCKQQPDACR